ncbi:hypothetical protein Ahy_B01g052343 [Arachis hypogaea]|uniref:Zinc knuckle CX2CX4HX4C domain-containing protein n=1 Tax=Arachis hypogaea TaxID=3818 RepID=A0A445AP70_ARAHY|nr:hypothetical protein Ahy_B01g052343 [Arachis hypogaea]
MLKIDKITSIHYRKKFARICVKIDLSKKLISRILVLGSTLNIEYEGLHLICFNYGLYGHQSEQCGKAPMGDGEHRHEENSDDKDGTVRNQIQAFNGE